VVHVIFFKYQRMEAPIRVQYGQAFLFMAVQKRVGVVERYPDLPVDDVFFRGHVPDALACRLSSNSQKSCR